MGSIVDDFFDGIFGNSYTQPSISNPGPPQPATPGAPPTLSDEIVQAAASPKKPLRGGRASTILTGASGRGLLGEPATSARSLLGA